MVLVDPEPPFPALCLFHAIFQDESLVQQLLVVGSVCYGQRDPEFIVQAPEELGLPLGISVHIIWSIAGQRLEVVHVLLQTLATLPQTSEFISLQLHGSFRDVSRAETFLERRTAKP